MCTQTRIANVFYGMSPVHFYKLTGNDAVYCALKLEKKCDHLSCVTCPDAQENIAQAAALVEAEGC